MSSVLIFQRLLAVLGLVACCASFEFEPRQQLQAADGQYVGYYDGRLSPAADEGSSRIHHGKHKLQKKLKKRLLLQCLLGHGRRRRDTDAASGRFLLPVVLQSTNVNVGSGGGGGGSYGDQQQHPYGGGGCMHMFNDHGLGGLIGSLGSPTNDASAGGGDGARSGPYGTDWNRYARQFHRSYIRPLYRLF